MIITKEITTETLDDAIAFCKTIGRWYGKSLSTDYDMGDSYDDHLRCFGWKSGIEVYVERENPNGCWIRYSLDFDDEQNKYLRGYRETCWRNEEEKENFKKLNTLYDWCRSKAVWSR